MVIRVVPLINKFQGMDYKLYDKKRGYKRLLSYIRANYRRFSCNQSESFYT